MTWDNFSPLCNAAYLTPDNFIETFKEFKPDFLFCEATWRGIEEFKNCWRTKVYKNRNLYFENRQALLQIIKYCNENNIKTVFWNKEDPYFINENRNNFFDTALLFDYIFTTAEECIPYYKNEGKNKVFFLPFSFAPWIFNPLNRAKKNNNAIFTGSWYNFAEERIDDTCKLFDYLLDNGYNLKIYDRNKKRNKDKSNFPKKYSQYIESAVPYSKTGELYRANDIAVNINTIKYSESMFARRVFEIMACATGIISNESKAMRMTFGNNVAFIDDKNIIIPNKESIRSNLKKVFKKYTVNEQFDFLCNTVLGKTESSNRIFVFCYSNIEPKFDKNRIIFQKIDSSNQLLENIKDIDFKLSDYAILVDNSNVDFEFLASQFLFIPQNVGVKETNDEHYYIIKSKDINNVLFKADNFKQIVLNTDEFDVYLA
ncbi:MAG: hypothetical protein GYA87_01235 [Christensenellaceae bacterium]|nr:hypothetical protein [Christensenellaceae bacterium]